MAIATPEMIELCDQNMRACAQREVGWIAENSFEDEEAGFVGIHTTPGPVDYSIQQAVDALGPVAKALSLDVKSQGWYIGDVAWFVSFFTGQVPDGEQFVVRGTTVMRRVNGVWKIAHWHVSEEVDRSAHFPGGH